MMDLKDIKLSSLRGGDRKQVDVESSNLNLASSSSPLASSQFSSASNSSIIPLLNSSGGETSSSKQQDYTHAYNTNKFLGQYILSANDQLNNNSDNNFLTIQELGNDNQAAFSMNIDSREATNDNQKLNFDVFNK